MFVESLAEAMTFDRPYRRALPIDTAKAEIVRMAGSQFDPLAVKPSFVKKPPCGK